MKVTMISVLISRILGHQYALKGLTCFVVVPEYQKIPSPSNSMTTHDRMMENRTSDLRDIYH